MRAAFTSGKHAAGGGRWEGASQLRTGSPRCRACSGTGQGHAQIIISSSTSKRLFATAEIGRCSCRAEGRSVCLSPRPDTVLSFPWTFLGKLFPLRPRRYTKTTIDTCQLRRSVPFISCLPARWSRRASIHSPTSYQHLLPCVLPHPSRNRHLAQSNSELPTCPYCLPTATLLCSHDRSVYCDQPDPSSTAPRLAPFATSI